MTVNSEKVLNYMKEHYGEELTKKGIAEALDVPFASVTGSKVFPSRTSPVKVKKLKAGFAEALSVLISQSALFSEWKGRFVELTVRIPSRASESISA